MCRYIPSIDSIARSAIIRLMLQKISNGDLFEQ